MEHVQQVVGGEASEGGSMASFLAFFGLIKFPFLDDTKLHAH